MAQLLAAISTVISSESTLMHYLSFFLYLTALAPLSSPSLVQAQCQPSTEPEKLQAPANQNASKRQPEFFDEPQFTVAGVTDTSNPAGHGSTAWRTSESLARETVSLGKKESSESLSSPVSEKSLREAAHEPGNFDANHLLGKLLLDERKPREALPYLEEASRLKPADYENAYELALAYAEIGDYEHSRASARALLAHQDRAELHHLLGEDEENLGNPLDAVHEYQRAAELEQSESNLFDWGSELLLHHAPEPASEVFAKGNHLFPRSGRMLIGLGVTWYSRGSYDRAAACLCQASDLNPNDSTAYLFLGKILSAELTPSDETVEHFKRFVALQPDNALANYYYAVSLWEGRKNADDAVTARKVETLLQNAVQLNPKLGAAYLQLGILYGEKNEISRSISAYEKAVDADPTLEAAHYRLAQMYRQSGDKLKAERELKIYERLSKQKTEQAERERRELQQFVYTLRGQTSGTQPQ
jgi:tetratricopeptide (TPR) repeat protein